MDATAPVVPANVFKAQKISQAKQHKNSSHYVQQEDGTLRGSNFSIPKGDFSHFLGYKNATAQEKQGKVSGERAIEVALQRRFDQIGKGATKRGEEYRNMYISWGRYTNSPGKEKELVKDGLDAVNSALEKQHAMGTRYLEMQYKLQKMSKSYSLISQLMRVRHEAVRKSWDQIR